MSATQEQVQHLRRMIADTSTTQVYSDDDLRREIQRYPYPDKAGLGPSDTLWTSGYDLNAAAAALWAEKAAGYAANFTFSANGASFQRSAQYEQAEKMAEYYRKRRLPTYLRVQREYRILNSDGTITTEVTQ